MAVKLGVLVDVQSAAAVRSLGKIGGAVKGLFAAAVVGKAAGAIKGFVDESISAASDLQQSTGAVEAVFGKQAAGIQKVAGKAAQSFGLSKNSYQELASTIGAGFKNKGIKDFNKATQSSIGLGADLAAQFGGSTKEAVEAIGSLMRGESDPIEKYGVSINETAISAELAAKGQDKLTGAALEQAKAQARLSLLFKQTKDAQGAFAREGDTLATKQQKNAASLENLKAKLGEVFLPAATRAQEFIANSLLPAFERMIPVVQSVANVLGPAADRIKAVVVGLFNLFAKGDYTGSLGRALGISEDDPIIDKLFTIREQVIAVFGQIRTALVAFATGEGGATLKQWITSVQALFMAVAPIVLQVVGTIVSAVVAAAPQLQTIATTVMGAFQSTASIIMSIAGIITRVWTAIGPTVLPIVRSVFTTVIGVISGAVQIIGGVLKIVASILKGDWAGAWKGAQQVFRGVMTVITSVLRGAVATVGALLRGMFAVVRSIGASIRSSMTSAWNAVKSGTISAWRGIVSAVKGKISELLGKVRDVKSRVVGFFSGAGSWLVGAGRRLISGLGAGIREKIDAAVGAVRAGVEKIRNLLPGSPIKEGPLLGWNNGGAGKKLMEFLARGIRRGAPQMAAATSDIARLIERSLNPALSPKLTPTVKLDAATNAVRPTASGGMAQTVYVDVRVDPTTNLAEVGRKLNETLGAYKRAGGKLVSA